MHEIEVDKKPIRAPTGKDGWFRAYCSCGEYETIGSTVDNARRTAEGHARGKNRFEEKGDSNGDAQFIENVRLRHRQTSVTRVVEAEHLEDLSGTGHYTCAEDGFIFYDGPGYLAHQNEKHPVPTVKQAVEDIITSANHVERELIRARRRRFPKLPEVTSVRWIIDGRVLFMDDKGATSTVDLDDILPCVEGWGES